MRFSLSAQRPKRFSEAEMNRELPFSRIPCQINQVILRGEKSLKQVMAWLSCGPNSLRMSEQLQWFNTKAHLIISLSGKESILDQRDSVILPFKS